MSKEQQELVAPEVIDAAELDSALTGTGVVKVENDGRVVHVPRDLTPASMLAEVVQRNPTPEVLEKMIALHERWEAMQAKKAFVAAMAAFKKTCPSVLAKTRAASFAAKGDKVGYKWTPLEDIVEQVTPHLSNNGLSVRWEQEQSSQGMLKVTCHVEHTGGHRESTSMQAPYDKSGAKNPVQGVGSTDTYLCRYTVLRLLGLATVDMDDSDSVAAQAGRARRPDKDQIKKLEALLQQVGPALRKAHQMTLDLAKRGKAVELDAAIEECLESLEPPKGGK